MRIIVLTKRQYMARDLLDDRYGRFRELPIEIAESNNHVVGVCLSYRHKNEGKYKDVKKCAVVRWHSLNIHRLSPIQKNNYWIKLEHLGKTFQPDLIWACSDAFHAIFGAVVAKKLGAALVIDLYDNFESYPATQFPLIKTLYRRSLLRADGITCVSLPLANYVLNTTRYSGPIKIIENGVPAGIFHPMEKECCRREFGLPLDKILIGTAGAISKSRDIGTLFKAFEMLVPDRMEIHLVLAGPCDKGLTLPKNDRVHYLGNLSPEKVPSLLSALNLSVICNRESAFGKYCFPQKFYESLACRVPTVAAATEVMRDLLKDHPAHLYQPENAESLAESIDRMIEQPVILSLKVPTWRSIGQRLEAFFKNCIENYQSQR